MLSKDDNVFIYISKDFNVFSHLYFQKRQCLHLLFKDFYVFSRLRFQKTTMFSFTFQRLQYLLSFIGLNVLIFVLRRTRHPLFLCFKKKKKKRKRTSKSSCFLGFTSLVARLNSKIAWMKLVSLSLLPFYFQ